MTAKVAVLRALSSALYHGGIVGPLTALAGRARRGPTFQVLTFHRVGDAGDPFLPAMPTRVFGAQMAHIARHYRVLTVEDLVERMRSGRVPRNALAITFDDGYRDNLTEAAPILARHGLPATIFLTTGCIGTGQIPWFDQLAIALKTTPRDALRLAADRILPLGTREERLRALEATLGYLKRVTDEERRDGLDRILDQLGGSAPGETKSLMLSWDEVQTLQGLGFAVGAHTVSHPILSRTSADRAREEICGCKRDIERHLGGAIRGFAYPNGGARDYTETVKHLVREAGFAWAVTTQHGLNTPRTPPLELRRGGPREDHLPTYALRLAYYRLAEP
ncbi:MAG: polysaccharide deacetylase family protein [Candidatus Rokubacteria bacterium]|nr:polysaccharide deacetylase family protein [Candidatus Rokubacteria bacterium]MBI3108757.1 polysaccharide deacetylase family protein [Candidatus Rokubacteria bacterium]